MFLLLTFVVNYAIIGSICKFVTLFHGLLASIGFLKPMAPSMNEAIVFYLPAIMLTGFVLLAISPMGGSFSLWRYRARKPLRKESEIIEPLFRSVVSAANRNIPNFNRNHDFYNLRVIDDITINACAIGRKTIILNTGSLMLPPEEIEGILAHELGHLYNGDSMRLLMSYTMEIVGNWFIAFLNMLIIILSLIPFLGVILVMIPYLGTLFFEFMMKLPIRICGAFGGRRKEYRADRFACDIGHDEHLEKLLNRFHEFSMEGQRTEIIAQFMETHPMTAERLRRIEQFQDKKQYRGCRT